MSQTQRVHFCYSMDVQVLSAINNTN